MGTETRNAYKCEKLLLLRQREDGPFLWMWSTG